MQEVYSKTLASVYEQLEYVTPDTTLQEVLEKACVTEVVYLKALHQIKTSSNQPEIVLKRTPYESNINNYKQTMMEAWEANLNVQFVTNVYSSVMYLASYISKPEKTLGVFSVSKRVMISCQNLQCRQFPYNIDSRSRILFISFKTILFLVLSVNEHLYYSFTVYKCVYGYY